MQILIFSQKKSFVSTWNEKYKDNIEYVSDFEVTEIDANRGIVISQFGDKIKGDVKCYSAKFFSKMRNRPI